MATAAQRRGLNGVSSLRRKLRKMEPFVQSGIRPAVTKTLINITETAKVLVPKDSGDLADAIEYKVSADGMAGVAGPSAKNAAVAKVTRGSAWATRMLSKPIGATSAKRLFEFFKGFWVEFGTKGSPENNIPPMPAQPYMRPAFDMNKDAGVRDIGGAVNMQLKRVSEL